LLALAGAIYYLVQAYHYAHTQVSVLDEGAYLLKGYFFVSGDYRPFQEYGFYTNHMPLSFLIPGFVQALVGPGLLTGRYFAILLGLSLLLAIWLTTKRLAGVWWATAVVWAFSLNPALIKAYSVATSQGLGAAMLAGALAFTLGESRSRKSIIVGSVLAGALFITRINLAPVFPLLLLYILWEHGRKTAGIALLSGGLVILIGHALYWPGILQLWATYIPNKLIPYLSNYRLQGGGNPSWAPTVSLSSRFLSLTHGFRYHLTALCSWILASILWITQPRTKTPHKHRIIVFLFVLISVLLIAHAWASLGNDYCVFCFQWYLTFFTPVALVMGAVALSALQGTTKRWQGWLLAAVIILVSTGIGYGAHQSISAWLLRLTIPRIGTFFRTGELLAGYVPLWEFLQNRVGIPYEVSTWLMPTIFGALTGLLVILLAWGLCRLLRAKRPQAGIGFAYSLVYLMLILAFLLSPTELLSGGFRDNDCSGDVIAAYESAGAYLAEVIPPDSLVYWNGGLSAAPLLYIPDVRIFPPQANDGYSYRRGGDGQLLYKFGLWNDELNAQWRQEADFLLIEGRYYRPDWGGDHFEEIGVTQPVMPCKPDSEIHIFRKITP